MSKQCPHGFDIDDPRGCAECDTEAYLDAYYEQLDLLADEPVDYSHLLRKP